MREDQPATLTRSNAQPTRETRHLRLSSVLGALSLAESVRSWIGLPDALRNLLSARPWPVRPDLTWLLTLALPWPTWIRLVTLATVGWAVGTAVVGVGLLLHRKGWAAVGLAAIAPSTALDLLLIPGGIAILVGRAAPGIAIGTPLAACGLGLMGSGQLIASAIGLVYFWWVWHSYRRIRAGAAETDNQGQWGC